VAKGKGTSSKSDSNGRASTRKRRRKEEFEDYSLADPKDIPEGPDVLVDVPVVKVDKVELEVDDLRAQVAVGAEVRDLVQLGIGAEAQLGKVELEIDGVEAQALLKARLDNVAKILERVVLTLDRNPELLRSVGRTVESVGSGAGKLLDETGDAVEEVGEGAETGLGQIGRGAGDAVGGLGEGLEG
jgi:hypothetical protein